MIAKAEIESLLHRLEDVNHHVLSVFLNIDYPWDKSHGQQFEVDFRAMVQALEPKIDSGFKVAADQAEKFIATYKPAGCSLIFFVDESGNVIWVKDANVPLRSQIHWLPKPYVLPLLELLDEHERYGVILVEKGKARIFTYCLGQIEEEKDMLPVNEVRSKKTANMDHLRSQTNFQRTAEMHVVWHLKHVSEELAKIGRHRQFERLILGGSKEAMDQITKLLPFELQLKIAGRLVISVDAEERELKATLLQIETQIEREKESELVRKLVEPDFLDARILGLEGVTVYVNKGLVHQLVYSEHFNPTGGKCSGCGYLYANQRYMCGRCESKINLLPNFLEELARAVIQKGGRLEVAKGVAADKLDKFGGIAAILKEEG